jgi:hypothetical protein
MRRCETVTNYLNAGAHTVIDFALRRTIAAEETRRRSEVLGEAAAQVTMRHADAGGDGHDRFAGRARRVRVATFGKKPANQCMLHTSSRESHTELLAISAPPFDEEIE